MNPKIIEYEAIENSNISAFNSHVAEMMEDGWQPVGPCTAFVDCTDTDCYVQTMVRYADATPINNQLTHE